MKKILLVMFLGILMLSNNSIAGNIVGPSEQVFIESPESIHDYTEFVGGNADSGAEMLRNIVNTLLDFLPKFLVPVMVVWIIYAGLELLLSQGKEDAFTEKKNQLISIGIGFGIIFLVTNLVDFAFFGKEGDIFSESGQRVEEYAKNAVSEMQGIFKYLSTFTVAVGTLLLVISSFKLILGGDNEDELGNVKKRIIYTTVGMIFMVSVEKIIGFLTKDQKISTPDHSGLIEIMVKTANFILGFLGLFALVALIWAGVRMITNFGDDSATEEAKKTIKGAIFGLVLAFSAFVIIQYLVSPQAA